MTTREADAIKKRWQRARQRTCDILAVWGEPTQLHPKEPVDYWASTMEVYVRVCLDILTDKDRKALEAFKKNRANGKRVYAHIYSTDEEKPKSVEIFPPVKS
jgi:hypothetical protein